MTVSEEIFIVETDLGAFVQELIDKSCTNVKVFYIVETFVEEDDVVNHILCVSPFMKQNARELFFMSTFEKDGFKQVVDRRDIRKQDYYDFIISNNTLSIETKIRAQFEYAGCKILMENIKDFTVLKIVFDTDDYCCAKDCLKNFKTVSEVRSAGDKSIEEIFYHRSLYLKD